MASPAVAVNGIASTSLSRPESPMSMASSSKRKRDDTDEGSAQDANQDVSAVNSKDDATIVNASTPTGNGEQQNKALHEPAVIRDYFRVLQKYALPNHHSIPP